MCFAAALTAVAVAYAQEPAQSSAQKSGSAADQQVTITGCIQREADYRKAQDAGKGGVAGTGVGAGNEFVLTNASMSKDDKPGTTPAPTGTAGAATTASAYELTGSNEGQAAKYVGRRVEITGKLKAAETTATGQPTGGATAGQPPRGVDVAGKDLKLQELEVSSVRESTGSCPADK
jgi:hypothetical protein